MYDKLMMEYSNFLLVERHLYNNSIDSYLNDVTHYFSYIEDNKIKNFYCKKTLLDYIYYLNDHDYKSKSVERKVSALRSFCLFYSRKYNKEDISKKIPLPKTVKSLPTYLSKEEVEELLNIKLVTPYDYRNKTMLELMYATGLRVSELCNLKLENLDLDIGIVRCFGKGMKERMVPIGDVALDYLKEYINIYRDSLKKKRDTLGYVFLNNHGTVISRQGFFKLLKSIVKNTHIKKEITPHTLRHSFATHLISNGADLRSVQEMMGHSNIGTTGIYLHVGNSELKNNYNTFHPRS